MFNSSIIFMLRSKLIINLLISFLLIGSTVQLSPFITEFIVPFDLPADDAKLAVNNQISRNDFKTNTFNTDNVTVSKLIYKSIYNGSNRIVDPKYFMIYIERNLSSIL